MCPIWTYLHMLEIYTGICRPSYRNSNFPWESDPCRWNLIVFRIVSQVRHYYMAHHRTLSLYGLFSITVPTTQIFAHCWRINAFIIWHSEDGRDPDVNCLFSSTRLIDSYRVSDGVFALEERTFSWRNDYPLDWAMFCNTSNASSNGP